MRKKPVENIDMESVMKRKEIAMKNFQSFVQSTHNYLVDNYENFTCNNEELRETSTKFYNFIKWIIKEDRTLKDYETIKEKYNEINKDGDIDKYFGYFKVVLGEVEEWCKQVDETVEMVLKAIEKDKGICPPDIKPVPECVNYNSFGIVCLKCGACGRKFE